MKAIYIGTAFTVVGTTPSVAPFATIEVFRECDNVHAILSANADGTGSITNPSAFADAFGIFRFYTDGVDLGYKIIITKDAFSYTLRNQAVGNAAQRDWPSVQFERLQRRARHFAALNLV